MRIGIVSSYALPHMGGLEIVAEQLFAGYRRRGHAVRWVTSRIPRETPARADDRVRVRTFDAAYEHLGLPLPLWGREGLSELHALTRWADVLQVHGPLYPTSLAAMVAARAAGTPAVITQHIQPSVYAQRTVRAVHRTAWRTMAAANLRMADGIIAVNPPAARYLESIQADFVAIPNGTDTDAFHPVDAAGRRRAREQLGLPLDGPLLIFVGRLVERKGLEVVLDALPDLGSWRALVVGDGVRRDEIPDHPALSWIPRLDPSQMPVAYQAADAVLFPARGEGLPLVVQEGMATGLPVLARDDEVFAGPLMEEGLLLPVRDASDVLAHLRTLDAPRRDALGAAGRAWAESRWSWEGAVDAHLAVLERAAGRR